MEANEYDLVVIGSGPEGGDLRRQIAVARRGGRSGF